jgi:hypothetical protein
MLDRYIKQMEDVFGDLEPPKMFVRARAIQRVLSGESIDDVTADTRLPKYYLRRWIEAVRAGDFYEWLGKREPTEDRIRRARQGIAQMMLGAVAEEHFEALATGTLGDHGFSVEDDRTGRTDTDYRVIDAAVRPVLRINIKFHGTLFRQAEEYVELAPNDCFALATYKIHGALQRQDRERLPYVFLIISVPTFPRQTMEDRIPDDLVWLASVSNRATEEAIASRLLGEPWANDVRVHIQQAGFRVISARRADALMRRQLFDRVHALRLRGFNNLFRGAEINMHLSLSREMIAFEEFLELLATRGERELTVRLDRGEI